jgi:glycosyltransferase involved in cell wall biosynthesis
VNVGFHVDQAWFSAPGGIGTYVAELAPALAAAGADVTLFRSDWADPAPSWMQGFSAVIVPGSIKTLYPAWDIVGRPPLPQELSTCAVIHATNHAAVPPVRDGQALVVTVHDLAFDRHPDLFPREWRLLYRTGVRAAVRRAHALLVPSRSTADDLIERGADPSRVHITPLAPSVPARSEDPAAAVSRLGIAEPYLLFVGTLEPRKNLVRLVRAYRQVAPDVPHSLVLAGGDGWHGDDLGNELARPAPGRIVRTGRVDPEDLDALYRQAAAFVYPSLYEGFGLPVLDAMARGVPVVTSDSSSLAELAGGCAILVDPTDVAEIAEGLHGVLTDRAAAADLASRALPRAAAYTWEATARATLKAYDAAVGEASQ